MTERTLMVTPVAVFHNSLTSKFGIPRQAGVVASLPGTIVLEKEYRTADALRGMEGFDYLWLLWGFSANKHKANGVVVRPPRLGGNEHLGVFATRSPYRPNPIGLSSVRIDYIDYDCPDAPVIHVLGADLMDGTPIYDIKPYIPYTDAHPEARGGFTDTTQWQPLQVVISDELVLKLASLDIDVSVLRSLLEQDPRPRYHDDAYRIYGMQYADCDIHFNVADNILTVLDVTKLAKKYH